MAEREILMVDPGILAVVAAAAVLPALLVLLHLPPLVVPVGLDSNLPLPVQRYIMPVAAVAALTLRRLPVLGVTAAEGPAGMVLLVYQQTVLVAAMGAVVAAAVQVVPMVAMVTRASSSSSTINP